jgi:hypothetical protein
MKTLLLIFVFAFFGIAIYSQNGSNNKFFEKYSEKYSVKTITISDRIFNVGDTITLLSGTGVNGTFLSINLEAMPMGEFPAIPANFMGRRFIILKIYHSMMD